MNKFPGTNFHDLNLDWVINQVKMLTTEWITTRAEWTDTKAEWQQLYNFVVNYFANLNVSDEINAKIDAMAANGTLLDIISDTVEATTISQTTSWLADHVNPSTGYLVDRSLSIQGAAADAKAAGFIRDDMDRALATFEPATTQLFDFDTMMPMVPYMLTASTSGVAVSENSFSRMYPIEVNAANDTRFTYAFVGTEDWPLPSASFSNWQIYASNALPVAGQNLLQYGTRNSSEPKGYITTGQASKYLIIQFMVGGYMTDEARNAIASQMMQHLVLKLGTGYPTAYQAYTTQPVYKVIPYDQGAQYAGKILKVGADGLVGLADESGGGGSTGSTVIYEDVQVLHLDDSVLAEFTLGDGWTGNLTDGFTHASGNTAPLTFSDLTVSGSAFLATFTTDNTSSSAFVNVQLGDSPIVDAYNGSANIAIGFISDGGSLKIIPASGFVGTLTNVKLRKVLQSGGTEYSQAVYLIRDHDSMSSDVSGFWNVALGGPNTMQALENGSRNVAIGAVAMKRLVTGTRNIAIGTYSMPWITEGDRNVAIGADTLYSLTSTGSQTAKDNIAIGKAALRGVDGTARNVAIGTSALAGRTASAIIGNVAIGHQAGYKLTDGNVAIGNTAGYNSVGSYNVLVGISTDAQDPEAPTNPIYSSIAIGRAAKATKTGQMVLGNPMYITEVVIAGKKLVFNQDGTITWTTP